MLVVGKNVMKISESLAIYIFSYNRPEYLENCLLSIIRHAHEFDVTVCDDDSTDPAVDTVIDQFNERVRVMKPSQVRDHSDSVKHGGLYRNMTWALQDAETRGFTYALFIQDDQQLVRPLLISDLKCFNEYFEKNLSNYELHTCFLKGRYRKYDLKRLAIDSSGHAYHRENTIGGGNDAFSDVGVFHVPRARAKHVEFVADETSNRKIARAQGAKMGFYRYPFMNWLPFPESFRGRKRVFGHRLLEMLGGSGFHPISDMSGREVEVLFSSNIKAIPVAEDYLHSATAPRSRFWGGGGASNTAARGGWRLFLGRFIRRFLT